jgi:imidazole glycerol phosphate synthase glutamine amidotransferase subunit
MIAIIDYGAGNLRSVKKAFDYLRVESQVISSPDQLAGAEKIVLPGVGAFGAAVQKLHESGFYDAIRDWLVANKPFLGICLGMQLLLEASHESPGARGLSLFGGENRRFHAGKVPQIGWNQVHLQRESRLFAGIPDGTFFYFLHGYYLSLKDQWPIVATTEYGIEYPSAIEMGNMAAVQFHPEKSGDVGLRLLKNWIELC